MFLTALIFQCTQTDEISDPIRIKNFLLKSVHLPFKVPPKLSLSQPFCSQILRCVSPMEIGIRKRLHFFQLRFLRIGSESILVRVTRLNPGVRPSSIAAAVNVSSVLNHATSKFAGSHFHMNMASHKNGCLRFCHCHNLLNALQIDIDMKRHS